MKHSKSYMPNASISSKYENREVNLKFAVYIIKYLQTLLAHKVANYLIN